MKDTLPPLTKYAAIGLFSPRGTSLTVYLVNGQVKQFGSYQQAEQYIADHGLPANASPIEVYEE